MTRVVAMPLTEASAKIRTRRPARRGQPEDAALPYWAGVIPFVTTRGERVPGMTALDADPARASRAALR